MQFLFFAFSLCDSAIGKFQLLAMLFLNSKHLRQRHLLEIHWFVSLRMCDIAFSDFQSCDQSLACCLQRLVQTSAYEVSARARARAREPFASQNHGRGQNLVTPLDSHAACKLTAVNSSLASTKGGTHGRQHIA